MGNGAVVWEIFHHHHHVPDHVFARRKRCAATHVRRAMVGALSYNLVRLCILAIASPTTTPRSRPSTRLSARSSSPTRFPNSRAPSCSQRGGRVLRSHRPYRSVSSEDAKEDAFGLCASSAPQAPSFVSPTSAFAAAAPACTADPAGSTGLRRRFGTGARAFSRA